MRIHWEKIKDGMQLVRDGNTAIYFVPTVGRVYITTKNEREAAKLGGNPVCNLEVVPSAVGESDPLYMIYKMDTAELQH